MKQRPILFSTPMVQAILAGRKTQTRRVVKPPKEFIGDWFFQHVNFVRSRVNCPYGQTGDVLWVRETFAKCIGRIEITPSEVASAYEWTKDRFIVYKADSKEETHPKFPKFGKKRWRPSIHMEKDFARIWLCITDVRVERLQDITEEDAMREGVLPIGDKGLGFYNDYLTNGFSCKNAVRSFESLWQSIHGEESWNNNPWVWVVEFKQIENPNK